MNVPEQGSSDCKYCGDAATLTCYHDHMYGKPTAYIELCKACHLNIWGSTECTEYPKDTPISNTDKEYLGEVCGMPVILDPKATETHFRAQLTSDPKPHPSNTEQLDEILEWLGRVRDELNAELPGIVPEEHEKRSATIRLKHKEEAKQRLLNWRATHTAEAVRKAVVAQTLRCERQTRLLDMSKARKSWFEKEVEQLNNKQGGDV